MTGECARIFWPAAPRKAITRISEAKGKKFSSGPYPILAPGHDLADGARHWIGVDHALNCSPSRAPAVIGKVEVDLAGMFGDPDVHRALGRIK
jgi:hypothetical protein